MKTLATQSLCSPARKWQWLAMISGLLLAVCFFLPYRNDPGNAAALPVTRMHDLFGEYSRILGLGWSLRDYGHYAAVWFLTAKAISWSVPYLAGTLLSFAAVSRLAGGQRLGQRLAKVVAVVLLIVAVSLAGAKIRLSAMEWVADTRRAEWPNFDQLDPTWVFGPIVFVIYLTLARRSRERTYLVQGFAVGLAASLWFGLGGPSGYNESLFHRYLQHDFLIRYRGLCLSFAASIGLLLAAVGEAAAVTRQSWRRTIRQLLTCRLAAPIDIKGACPGCGYNLYGLAEQRCPECGRAFTFEEIGATPKKMGFPPVSDRPQESLSGTRSCSESPPATDR